MNFEGGTSQRGAIAVSVRPQVGSELGSNRTRPLSIKFPHEAGIAAIKPTPPIPRHMYKKTIPKKSRYVISHKSRPDLFARGAPHYNLLLK